MMINLGDEVMELLNHYGYDRTDIDWIGNYEFRVSTNWFFSVAEDTDYDNGYGMALIPYDLIIVMNDGCWFSRHEYDGKEWFTINRPPAKPAVEKNFAYDKLVAPHEYRYELDANWLRWFVEK